MSERPCLGMYSGEAPIDNSRANVHMNGFVDLWKYKRSWSRPICMQSMCNWGVSEACEGKMPSACMATNLPANFTVVGIR